MTQTNWKFNKYVIHHKHSMTPEQLKQKPFKPIIKIKHRERLDTEEGESNKDEEETTTSSEMSEQDSASDTTTDDDTEGSKSTEDEGESEATETLQIHNVCNTIMHDDDDDSIHDEDDSSGDENVIEIEPHTVNGEQDNAKENKLLTTNFEVKVET